MLHFGFTGEYVFALQGVARTRSREIYETFCRRFRLRVAETPWDGRSYPLQAFQRHEFMHRRLLLRGYSIMPIPCGRTIVRTRLARSFVGGTPYLCFTAYAMHHLRT